MSQKNWCAYLEALVRKGDYESVHRLFSCSDRNFSPVSFPVYGILRCGTADRKGIPVRSRHFLHL